MAQLTAKKRKRIPKTQFALGNGRYPIPDRSHARNALARVAQHGTPSEQKRVKAAVHRKYPDIGTAGQSSNTKNTSGSTGGNTTRKKTATKTTAKKTTTRPTTKKAAAKKTTTPKKKTTPRRKKRSS